MTRRWIIARMHGLLVRYGLLEHPYGQPYVREHYDRLGRFHGGRSK